ncbi:hypothetical protein Ddc_09451 [Ditylenchus destructor]|nr:hypothetical protein Ddc_09451 [Ditylenchus destructor]
MRLGRPEGTLDSFPSEALFSSLCHWEFNDKQEESDIQNTNKRHYDYPCLIACSPSRKFSLILTHINKPATLRSLHSSSKFHTLCSGSPPRTI